MSSRFARRGTVNAPRATPTTVCQKCLGTGHFIYECKNPRPYVSRPSRTKQLEDPKHRAPRDKPSVEVPEEFKNGPSKTPVAMVGTADAILAKKEKERASRSKRSASSSSASRSSDSSGSSSDSESDSESGSDSRSSRSASDSRSRSRSFSRSLSRTPPRRRHTRHSRSPSPRRRSASPMRRGHRG